MGRSTSSPTRGVRPGAGCPSRGRPIDLVHLVRQTLGDEALEQEMLGLMIRQIQLVSARIDLATEAERRQIVHALRGAARNIGAFLLADAAEAFERQPDEKAVRAALAAEMARTAGFIARLRALDTNGAPAWSDSSLRLTSPEPNR